MAQNTFVTPTRGRGAADLAPALWRLARANSERILRLLFGLLLGGVVFSALRPGHPLVEIPASVWAVAAAAVGYLAPLAGLGLASLLLAAAAFTLSLALALLAVAGAAAVLLLFGESRGHQVPLRAALLVAAPWLAGFELAGLPLAAAAVIFGPAAWMDGLVQGLAIALMVAAVGTSLPWLDLVPPSSTLAVLGGPVPLGEAANQLGKVLDGAVMPWAMSIVTDPVRYLKVIGIWSFAGFVGGSAVQALRERPPRIRVLAALVAPIVLAAGLDGIRSMVPEAAEVMVAVVVGVAAWVLAELIASVRTRVPAFVAPRPRVAATVPPPRSAVAAGRAAGAPPPRGAVAPPPRGAGAPPPPRSGARGVPAAPAQEAGASTSRMVAAEQLRKARWSDVAGYDDVKREVAEALEPLVNQELREKLAAAGIEPTRGVLLYGPPGTGKTQFVRAAASEMGLGLVAVSGPEVLNKYVGESEAGVREAFEEARANAPAIIFFDEIEALVPPRGGGDAMGGVQRTLVATFLGLMDGVKDMGDIVVLAATNAPDQIDSALLRPGRFDRVIYVPAPDPAARRAILQHHLRGKPGADQVDVEQLVKRTERFTGADLAGLVRRAYEATRGAPITTKQLLDLVHATHPTVTLAMLDHYKELHEQYGRSSHVMAEMDAAPRPKLKWDDVAGLDQAKQALREAVMLPLENPELVTTFGVRPSRGVLLYGPPGTGKTLLARVVADQAKATFISAAGPELAGPEGPEAIRHLFARAREAAPSIIFIDEIDAIGGRGLAIMGGTAVHQLLVEMDGVKPAEGLVVLAATNRPEELDEALVRAGRFDARVEVGLPDAETRRAILALHLTGKPGAEAVDLELLSRMTEGCSPADIAGAVNAAAQRAAMAAMAAARAGGAQAAGARLTTESVAAQLIAQATPALIHNEGPSSGNHGHGQAPQPEGKKTP